MIGKQRNMGDTLDLQALFFAIFWGVRSVICVRILQTKVRAFDQAAKLCYWDITWGQGLTPCVMQVIWGQCMAG